MNDLGWAWIPIAPPSLARFLAPRPQPIAILPLVAVVLLVGYLTAATSMWSRRRRWPVGRALLFSSGCLLLAASMGTQTEGYGYRLFSVFMFQQLTLMIAIPPLLVLGAPFRLALRAIPRNGLGRVFLRGITAVTFSRPYRWVLHPAFGIPVFLLTYYGLYLSSLGSTLLGSWLGHNGLEVGFLLTGILFAVPILTVGPGPIYPGYPSRMLDVFAEMALARLLRSLDHAHPQHHGQRVRQPATVLGHRPVGRPTDRRRTGLVLWRRTGHRDRGLSRVAVVPARHRPVRGR